MNCKICNSSTTIISNQLVLNKYKVNYHQCDTCKFVETDKPFWLKEAYQSAITSLDIGLVNRNLYLQNEIPKLLDLCFPFAKVMLDYGGGYGMFVRMMRDLGYNFYRQDIYCENLFATYFDITDHPNLKTDVVTAFEVFEHLEYPLIEVEKMMEYSQNIIFSTVLIPATKNEFKNWWYVTPQTGQHIAFYSKESLEVIAKKNNVHFYTNDNNLHLFSKEKIGAEAIKKVFHPQKSIRERVSDKLKKQIKLKTSLLQTDYDYILNKLISRNENNT